MTRKGKAMTADDLLLGERKVVGCFTLPALRCAWERVLKKDAQDGDISDSVERFAEGFRKDWGSSPRSSGRGRTGPRT